jgi:hypothetical protein
MKTLLALTAAAAVALSFTSCTGMNSSTPSNLPMDGGIGDGVNPPGDSGL